MLALRGTKGGPFVHWHWSLAATPGRILLVVLVALVLRLVLYRLIGRLVRRASAGTVAGTGPLSSALLSERRKQRARTIGMVLRSISSATIFAVAAATILGELGINLAPVLASAGIVGVAVGFGAQNLVKDFLSGMFMILEDQYGVGDVVDAGTATGTVEAVGLRTTRLRDADGTIWYLRNGEIARIGNKSQGSGTAVVDISVAAADVDRARKALQAAADSVATEGETAGWVRGEPEVLGVQSLGADTVGLRVTLPTEALRQEAVARELRTRLAGRLARAKITLR